MKRMAVGEAIVHCLIAEGTDLIFGQPGSHTLRIYDALKNQNTVRHITVKHEGNAAVMADIYGRLTGRPGICLTTAGPGATHCVTGIAQSYAARSPLIHISGHVDRSTLLPFHGLFDYNFLINIFQSVTKESFLIQTGSEIMEVIPKAFAIAQSGRKGPVHIEIPTDLLESEEGFVDYVKQGISYPEVDDGRILEAAEILKKSKAPILLGSLGVTRGFAHEEMIGLAQRLSAPVMTPWNGRSTIPFDHPLALGYAITGSVGHFIPPAIKEIIFESDAVLVVGSDLGEALHSFLKAHPAVIYLDCFKYPDSISNANPGLTLHGEIRRVLKLLMAQLDGFTPHPTARQRVGKAQKAKYQVHKAAEAFVAATQNPRHIGLILSELRRALGRAAIVASDTGIIDSWMFSQFPSQWPHHLLTGGRFGAMGFALPAAIAAKLCFPDRLVAAICGDGSFLMASSDFPTAVEHRLKIIFIILNDRQFGTIKKMQEIGYEENYFATEILSPDFIEYASSFGVKGFHVGHFSEIQKVFGEAMTIEGPTLISIDTDSQVPLFTMA